MTLIWDDCRGFLLMGGHVSFTHFWGDGSPLLLAIGLKFCDVLRPTFMNPAFQ